MECVSENIIASFGKIDYCLEKVLPVINQKSLDEGKINHYNRLAYK